MNTKLWSENLKEKDYVNLGDEGTMNLKRNKGTRVPG